ncbi:uncharacterized protein LOC135376409 [Ornithodoros turicata]|uniref:uncharacterized protein LOC135376409 n=1 Tax=Ornithodoros turicata TaxID=34597 RepID=UPI003139BDA5
MAFKDIAMAYRVGIETSREAVHLTCVALWNRLKDLHMMPPKESQWRSIAGGFSERWNFPNCTGAVDGKHIRIAAPSKSGSTYFNYKGHFSIVLMAVVDSLYRFTLIDVGAEGRQSDSGVFKASALGHHLDAGTLGMPGMMKLPQSNVIVPHVFVGDEAFQLKPNFLRPYSGRGLSVKERVFNLRLSRARHCAENAFGILASRWRILLTTINLNPSNVDNVVKAACVLHNFLADCCGVPSGVVDQVDRFGNITEGSWHAEAGHFVEEHRLERTSARNHSRDAARCRDLYANYFVSSAGQLEWQWPRVGAQGPQN